jgi:hypothetical protein
MRTRTTTTMCPWCRAPPCAPPSPPRFPDALLHAPMRSCAKLTRRVAPRNLSSGGEAEAAEAAAAAPHGAPRAQLGRCARHEQRGASLRVRCLLRYHALT